MTDRVREMYMRYPFPDADYNMDYGFAIFRYLKSLSNKRPDFWENAAIIEAGCGTGNTMCQLSRHFPSASFTGVDLTPASLAKAEARRAQLGLNNLAFQEGNILSLDLGRKFDVVMCIGVLHHLADMQVGIERLRAHMAPGGVMLLWLYGKHGRYRLNLNQRMFDILLRDVQSLDRKVELAEAMLTEAATSHVTCHFNVPSSAIEDNWEQSLDYALKHPQWLVDQFLHVNEKVVDMEDILALAKHAGLRLTRWIGVEQDLGHYVSNKDLIKLFDGKSETDKLVCLDMLLKPNYYTVVLEE